jgi:hypothetical protein
MARKVTALAPLTIKRTDHGPYGYVPGNMYSWSVIDASGVHVASGGFGQGKQTGYPRKGGSGKGYAVNEAYRALGFRKLSDREMRSILESYPDLAELTIDAGGGISVKP